MNPKDFLYSKKLDLYISRTPLYISSRVHKAAKNAGVDSLGWDEQGRINNISFIDAKKVLQALGSSMLSVHEYAIVLDELENERPDHDKLLSNDFAEWLDTIFWRRNESVFKLEHPTTNQLFSSDPSEINDVSEIKMPTGRPGWFRYDSKHLKTMGVPEKVEQKKISKRGTKVWKFWSTFRQDIPVAGIRGYVLSSGTHSLDLDIPLFAKQPKLMVRECRRSIADIPTPNETANVALQLVEDYRKTLVISPIGDKKDEVDYFFSNFEEKTRVIKQYFSSGYIPEELEKRSLDESIIDIHGKFIAYQQWHGKGQGGINKEKLLTSGGLCNYLGETKTQLISGVQNQEKIIVVMGHGNPDSDSIVSSIFEAYRRSCIYHEIVIPVVDGVIPPETVSILGEELVNKIITTNDEIFQVARQSGLVRWVLVDWHEFETPQFVEGIIDHHFIKRDFPYFVSISAERSWASTLQVYNKILGNGFLLDKKLAKILFKATLLEAEYELMNSMTYIDRCLFEHLRGLAQVENSQLLSKEVAKPLLLVKDPAILFQRDYKQSHPMLGFSVVKTIDFYNREGTCEVADIRESIIQIAHANNKSQNLPLTIIKFVDYLNDGTRVNHEEIVCVFNHDWHDSGFRDALLLLLERAYSVFHEHKVRIQKRDNTIQIFSPNKQVPRLILTPLLEPLLNEHTKFFYAKALNKFVARGFYDGSSSDQDNFSADVIQKPQNYLSFLDIKRRVKSSNISILSLSEYWGVYKEAEVLNDRHMLNSLRDSSFVELLDTFILDKSFLFDHANVGSIDEMMVAETKNGKRITITEAHPGMMKPSLIDENGLPKTIFSADTFGDPESWRYWAPDTDLTVATRGHIFLLDQTSLDLKIHPDESHSNMGFRPVYDTIPDIKYRLVEENSWVKVEVTPRRFGIY
ncbi:MAG: hypothetical protein A3B96_00885 [Candidatus Spechtbacteria bacterium RIFCSPHIGHO2_02_FULL_43_15b]|nr:MAG: hypothetical protein A3B96_00885 [Candidatus Spechtbacteria bacterium RIFCSPHIGHO2_02_FULL_43_15b]